MIVPVLTKTGLGDNSTRPATAWFIVLQLVTTNTSCRIFLPSLIKSLEAKGTSYFICNDDAVIWVFISLYLARYCTCRGWLLDG